MSSSPVFRKSLYKALGSNHLCIKNLPLKCAGDFIFSLSTVLNKGADSPLLCMGRNLLLDDGPDVEWTPDGDLLQGPLLVLKLFHTVKLRVDLDPELVKSHKILGDLRIAF